MTHTPSSELTGGLPNKLSWPLYKSSQTDEYALELHVGDGNVVTAAIPVCPMCPMDPTSVDGIQVRGLGTDHLHAEVPRGARPGPDARLDIEVRERPERGLLRASLLAAVTLVALAWLRGTGPVPPAGSPTAA